MHSSPVSNGGAGQGYAWFCRYSHQIIEPALDNQLSLFEDRVDTVICTIKQWHGRKLALDYLSNDQYDKL